MQTTAIIERDEPNSIVQAVAPPVSPAIYQMHILNNWQRKWVRFKIRVHLFNLAMRSYRSVGLSIKVLRRLYLFKASVLGGNDTKIVEINGRYHYDLYAPAYPSKIFDSYIEAEFHRIVPLRKKVNALSFIFFAITKKCPLQCEHCFEWDNLNKQESLSSAELMGVIKKFTGEGIAQFHLSGGEPLVRIKDLAELIRSGYRQTEFYVLTSGFNFTAQNAATLKNAGLTGVVISLDHFDPEMHNAFRGFKNSYDEVIKAIYNAQQQNLVITLSICVTKAFISWDNLLRYAELAKSLRVPFIQVLEPKAIGHYKNKDVLLKQDDLQLLERFYHTLNFDKAYENYPVVLYHGYHQRRMGCLSGGNRNLYIDSEGYVNACPFCHTKNVNIKEAIHTNVQKAVQLSGCQLYKNAGKSL